MLNEKFKPLVDAINESDKIRAISYPASDDSLSDNQVFLKIEGIEKRFKITIETED